MKATAFLIILSLFSLPASSANPREMRTHYKVIDSTRATIYDATVISAITPEKSSETYLLRNNKTGRRLRIQVDRDARKHEVTAEYTVDGHAATKVRLLLPSATPTLRGSAADYRNKPDLRNADVPIQIESTTGVLETSEKHWKADVDGVKAKARKKVDRAVSDSVNDMLPALAFPALASACTTVPFVADGQSCRFDINLAIGSGPDDCAFDREFRVPCTAK